MGGVWEEAVDWREGNSGVGCVGFIVGVSGEFRWTGVVLRGGMAGK